MAGKVRVTDIHGQTQEIYASKAEISGVGTILTSEMYPYDTKFFPHATTQQVTIPKEVPTTKSI